jgi:hypothetical protein
MPADPSSPDAVEMVNVGRDMGHDQYLAAEIIEAQQARRGRRRRS